MAKKLTLPEIVAKLDNLVDAHANRLAAAYEQRLSWNKREAYHKSAANARAKIAALLDDLRNHNFS